MDSDTYFNKVLDPAIKQLYEKTIYGDNDSNMVD